MSETTLTVADGAGSWAAAPPQRSILIGLDGEMSGSERADGHRLIQVGLAVRDGENLHILSELVGWEENELLWDEAAAAVHRIDRTAVTAAAPADRVDRQAAAFLTRRLGPLAGRAVISVGFNVAAFDHPFFRDCLPETMRHISRRAVDLNAVCFAMDGLPGPTGRAASWQRWKKESCRWADGQLQTAGLPGGPHDAGWDAGRALLVLQYLRAHLPGTDGRHPDPATH